MPSKPSLRSALRDFRRFDRWQNDLLVTEQVMIPQAPSQFNESEVKAFLGALAQIKSRPNTQAYRPRYVRPTPARVAIARTFPAEKLIQSIDWSDPEAYLVRETKLLTENQKAKALRKVQPSQLLSEATSLTARAVERHVAELQPYVQLFSRHFGCRSRANVYITPAQSQTLARHWDDHDVILFQTQGTKQWKITEPLQPYPLTHGRAAAQKAALEVTVVPGSLLYIPRGFQHEAFSQNEISSHVTFGLYAVNQLEILPWLFSQLLRRAPTSENMRQSVIDFPRPNRLETLFEELEKFVSPKLFQTFVDLQQIAKDRSRVKKASSRPTSRQYRRSSRDAVLLPYASRGFLRLLVSEQEVRMSIDYLDPICDILAGEKVNKINLPEKELQALLDLLWSLDLLAEDLGQHSDLKLKKKN